MQKVLINMRNSLLCRAIEEALKNNGSFGTVTVKKPAEVIANCLAFTPDILLMGVTGYSPWKLSERLAIRDEVKKTEPNCKVVLIVDENSEKELAEQVKQAKKDGAIDLFIYGSTSATFLAALLETL